MPATPYSIVILISGNGSNLQAIIDQLANETNDTKISAVISNRPDAYGLERAKKSGIPTESLDHTQFDSREAFDQQLAKCIDQYQPDLVVLSGFMRILSDGFVKKYQGKLINIHPSLLPAYKGLHTHKRALEDEVKEHGASVHFVIPELDAGNVIVHGVVPVKEGDDEESLRKRVHKIEHIIYPKAIQWLSEGKLHLKKEKTYLDNKLLLEPVKIYLKN